MAQHKLIVDAGSTNIRWIAIGPDGKPATPVVTAGVNAAHCDDARLRDAFTRAAAALDTDGPVSELHYYGAGCGSALTCSRVADALGDAFRPDMVEVGSDMLGAARGMLGDDPGIACILGTGSNSCLYDGAAIADNVPPLGFILGDEGSGAALGKRLLNAIFKRRVASAEIVDDFHRSFAAADGESDTPLARVIATVYRGDAPSRYLASLAPFILRHIDDSQIHEMVVDEFCRFLDLNLVYPGCRELPVCFTGGVAFAFATQLEEACAMRGFTVGRITPDPVPGLVEYHLKKSTHPNQQLPRL